MYIFDKATKVFDEIEKILKLSLKQNKTNRVSGQFFYNGTYISASIYNSTAVSASIYNETGGVIIKYNISGSTFDKTHASAFLAGLIGNSDPVINAIKEQFIESLVDENGHRIEIVNTPTFEKIYYTYEKSIGGYVIRTPRGNPLGAPFTLSETLMITHAPAYIKILKELCDRNDTFSNELKLELGYLYDKLELIYDAFEKNPRGYEK